MSGRLASSAIVPKITIMYKGTTTNVISRFDFVQDDSGKISRMTTATDNLDFCGVALDDSASGDNSPIRVIENSPYNTGVEFIYDFETATTALHGEHLAFATLQKLENTNSDPIMRCVFNSSSSAKEVRCVMLLKAKANDEYLGDAS